MRIRTIPNTLEKLAQIADSTAFEPAGDQPQSERTAGRYQSHSLAECITNVTTPRGKMPVLKTMVTTACERNCYYCPFRAGRARTQRVTFTPDELASALDQMSAAGRVQGMFLSSGIIKGGVTTQDKIIDTAEIVRRKRGYRGYLHLKIMPGAERDQLYRAMQLADRISVNLEGPTQARLEALAPKKDFTRELLDVLLLAQQIRRDHPSERLAGSVTQFVVGAVLGDLVVDRRVRRVRMILGASAITRRRILVRSRQRGDASARDATERRRVADRQMPFRREMERHRERLPQHQQRHQRRHTPLGARRLAKVSATSRCGHDRGAGP